MPISATASSTTAGVHGDVDAQSASSRSALPQRLEMERLPCLATVTPPPATTKAVVVEMLNVPAAVAARAAGVDHRPTACAWMRAAWRRIGRGRPGQLLEGLALGGERRHERADLGVGERA